MNPIDPAGPDAGSAAPLPAAQMPFIDRLRRCVGERQADGRSLALLLVDCGVIGRIDPLWGYQVGDAVRTRIVASLRTEALRPGDFIGELGRDDLACVLSEVEGAQLALLAAEKTLRIMNAPLWLGEDEIYASPSIGIAIFPASADGAESLLWQARSACATASGLSGRIAFYEEERKHGTSLLVGESRLRSAIAEDALELVFQPQFDLRFGQIMGVEAMLCWRDGTRGQVPMRDAIKAAEAGGLVPRMISSLLNRALHNCSEFRQRAGLDLRVAVKLPARALLHPELAEIVERALRTWSLRPGRLMLEIGDLATLEAHARAQAEIRRLQEIGVKLSMDDAHAPLSSLFRLASMPFQEMKIDLSVVPDWTTQARSEGVLRSLIELAHQLKLDVVSTAVADEAAAARLLELGCDFMQADFRGAAVTAEEFIARYAS
ncbi:MAG: EAL domain-containing protein [Burkholderiales bacterium]|nr:EAL domain-containing protein [Burkholderiales bacterium]